MAACFMKHIIFKLSRNIFGNYSEHLTKVNKTISDYSHFIDFTENRLYIRKCFPIQNAAARRLIFTYLFALCVHAGDLTSISRNFSSIFGQIRRWSVIFELLRSVMKWKSFAKLAFANALLCGHINMHKGTQVPPWNTDYFLSSLITKIAIFPLFVCLLWFPISKWQNKGTITMYTTTLF